MSKSTLHLDLHPIAKNGRVLDDALHNIFREAAKKRAKRVEIIPGKGSGQLMKRVRKFLEQPEIKSPYIRVQVDSNNHGRLFVYF